MPAMNATATITQAPRRAPRSDGAEARHRLLHTALRLFAQKGFAKTSTREIAREAEVNISAISYYFGDKEGLYAATFNEPMGGDSSDLVAACNVPGQSLEATLRICMSVHDRSAQAGRDRAPVHPAAHARDAGAHQPLGRGARKRHQGPAPRHCRPAVPPPRSWTGPTTTSTD
jgi:AcrR family transcriptional regulator